MIIYTENDAYDPSISLNADTFFGYGFAPGKYMCTCSSCGAIFGPADKRSITCLSCAQKLINQSNQGAKNGMV